MSLKAFRERYQATLLHFLWQQWTALGVAGREKAALHHVIDPEALLLFTCSVSRYDPRLFDEVVDWLIRNGRFMSVQRLNNIARTERFAGAAVMSAIADWLSQHDPHTKWKLLGRKSEAERQETLFFLPDGRPLPRHKETDAVFAAHGFLRNPLAPRGHSQSFSASSVPCLVLKLRALFGITARCEVLAYLAQRTSGHVREIARETYYSQKAIHDAMCDMACSGIIHSVKLTRERSFRIDPAALPLLSNANAPTPWINWPVLLSTAEAIWWKLEQLRAEKLSPLMESAEITLTLRPLLERLAHTHWMPSMAAPAQVHGIALMETFLATFEKVAFK